MSQGGGNADPGAQAPTAGPARIDDSQFIGQWPAFSITSDTRYGAWRNGSLMKSAICRSLNVATHRRSTINHLPMSVSQIVPFFD
jgi:hypothetical protein